MSELIIAGGGRLSGSVRIGGAKNAALPILAATLLCGGEVTLFDCPELRDVSNMLEILRVLGCRASREAGTVSVDASSANSYIMPHELSKELRSSIFMLGPVLARFGRAHFAYPAAAR